VNGHPLSLQNWVTQERFALCFRGWEVPVGEKRETVVLPNMLELNNSNQLKSQAKQHLGDSEQDR